MMNRSLELPPDRSLELARSLESRGAGGIRVAIVAGSGLGAIASALEHAEPIPFAAVEGMPAAAVPGHAGRFLAGDLGGVRVLLQQGRVHLYEGRSAEEATRSVRAFARIGCSAVVLLNAAGGLRRDWKPPVLMRIEDHVNLTGASPLSRHEAGAGRPYDGALAGILAESAEEIGVPLERGIYAGLVGPSYETPAEIRMLAWAGADAVGMSTVLEVQAARAAGMRVAAIACITNHAAGIAPHPLSHEEVLSAGRAAAGSLAMLLARALPRIAEAT
jgi:purine-nucleoside phosphorylase